MAGPWEKYAAEESGPWAKYQSETKEPGLPADMVKARDEMGQVGTNIKNLVYGAAKGTADTVQSFGQTVLNSAVKLVDMDNGRGVGSDFLRQKTTQFNDHLRNQEDQYQADTKGSAAAGLGRVGASVAPFLAPTKPAQAVSMLANPSTMSRIGTASVQGGAFGGLQPVNNAQEGNFFGEKAKQIGLGSTVSGAAVPVGNALSRMIKPEGNAGANALIKDGVTPTPGQILGGWAARVEEKMASFPFLGDAIKGGQRRAIDEFNVAAYDRALKPIGEKFEGKAGREGVEEVKKKLGVAYDDLLPNLQFKADPQFSSEITSLTSLINNGNVPPKIASQFESIVKNDVFSRMTKQGAMDGKSFKELETALNLKIKGYSQSLDPDQKAIGKALETVLESARTSLARANPAYAPQLTKINEGYANYARIRDAAAATGAVEGIFTPAQLQAAVRRMDKSAGKGDFATGNAFMQDFSETGKTVLGSKYPDSGTAGRIALPAFAGAAGTVAPITTALTVGGLALGSLPYTQAGQKMAANMLLKRPASAIPIANGVRQFSPIAGAAVSPLLPELRK